MSKPSNISNFTPHPRESILEEWSDFVVSREFNNNDHQEILDFFLSRCIPRDELKEEVEKMKKPYISDNEIANIPFASQVKEQYFGYNKALQDLLALISNK